jgi:DNA integrity scanning protein DisA with diadenylate cyclase activity
MNVVTERILDYSLDLAQNAEADAVLLYADVLAESESLQDFLDASGEVAVVLASRAGAEAYEALAAEVIKVPDVKLTRMGQLKIAILLGLSRGAFSYGDRLICMTGIAATGLLDTLLFTEIGEEFEMYASSGASEISEELRPEVLETVLDIAVSLGTEGREGKPVGTTFVVGDSDAVLQHCQSMVLNPFRGYPPEERDIQDEEVQETLKEFSTIDGAFVVRGDGVVEAAGMFLKTSARSVEIPRGLGARHRSAAAITAMTRAVSVTVSESSGDVTVFRNGRVVTEIEKPHPIGGQTGPRRRFFGEGRSAVDFASESRMEEQG